jgi:4-hydroxy-3-methylbut-2-en-1-yl diphosphate synthase IspG/GcpE
MKVAAFILTVSNILRTITVGKVPIGSAHPVAKQTMATTVTKDVEASVAQVMMPLKRARIPLF